MNKVELANAIAEKIGFPKKQTEDMLDALTDIITSALRAGGEVTIAGFGTFSAKHRSARGGVNPQNPKERIQIPAVTVPKFKAGKALKDALKGKRESSKEAPTAMGI